MAVLPGSLDYLYYNGILDHIPYEAYETAPAGSMYLNTAQQGNLYNNYATDTFVKQNNIPETGGYNIKEHLYGDPLIGSDVDYEVMANGEEGKSFRQSILDAASSTKDKISSTPSLVKGGIATGLLALTAFCLLRGKKKPPVSTSAGSFWSKLNPVKWFKK